MIPLRCPRSGPPCAGLQTDEKGLRPHWMTRAAEDEIVRGFLACTLPKSQWTHLAHLRVGLWHVLEHGAQGALELLRVRICAYNESTGVANTDSSGYHETITRFYVGVIDAFTCTSDLARPFDDLARELIVRYGDRDLPLRYYSRERLFSVLARRSWLPPDEVPLPAEWAFEPGIYCNGT